MRIPNITWTSVITTKDNNPYILILKIQGYSFHTAHAPIASGKKVSPYSSYYGYIPTFLLVTTIRTPLTVTDTRTLSATGW